MDGQLRPAAGTAALNRCARRPSARPPAVQAEQDHHADDRAHQTTQVERVFVADPETESEDHPTERRAREAQQDGDEETARIVTRHECLADEAGNQPEYPCTYHSCLLR